MAVHSTARVCPTDSFTLLKLMLLLSIVSSSPDDGCVPTGPSKDPEQQTISLLILSDNNLVRRLVRYALQLHVLGTHICGYPKASQLPIMYDNGIVCVEGAHPLSRRHLERVRPLTESAQGKNVIRRPAHMALWHMVTPHPTSKKSTTDDNLEHSHVLHAVDHEQAFMFNAVLFHNDAVPTGDTDAIMADFLLSDHLDKADDALDSNVPGSHEPSDVDWKRFLCVAADIKVAVPDEIRQFTQAYFLCCRQAQEYSIVWLKSMIRFAKSHARLHLRSSVTIADALMGIMLVEETVAALGRPTALEFRNLPQLDLNVCKFYEGDTDAKRFENFFCHVVDFMEQQGATVSFSDDWE